MLTLGSKSSSLEYMRLNSEDPNNEYQASPVHEPFNIQNSEHPCDRDHQVDLFLQQNQPIPNQPSVVPKAYLTQLGFRPVSHAQLVVEMKGIYAGLVLIEEKCIEVNKKQMAAIQEYGPTRRAPLHDDQWQVLIALHKTLLHEHHDFFLATHHPAASPALPQLPTKYSMAKRAWDHGIRAFLQVLWHRLPASSEHMRAFIYMAYSMVALFSETVAAFKETWMECLGDLARYRVAIEQSSTQDHETWVGAAKFWYSMAADKSRNIGRLYHYLAEMDRPSLQQLALYAMSLDCAVPFLRSRRSMMSLFQSELREKPRSQRPTKAFEISFIKIHANLFAHGQPTDEVSGLLRSIKAGLLDNHISLVTTVFREQGIYIALTNIAAIFGYGAPSIIRRALLEAVVQEQDREANLASHRETENAFALNEYTQPSATESLTQQVAQYFAETENVSSMDFLNIALDISFSIFSIVLQRPNDVNGLPHIHVMFCCIWSLARVEKAISHVERDIPWVDVCAFLNTVATPDAMTPKLWSETLPEPDGHTTQLLPEDFAMREAPMCVVLPSEELVQRNPNQSRRPAP
ncbi:MAG: hypothetical protein Q9220_007725 [cf. Caloplaca sp. 1 TL-2023]